MNVVSSCCHENDRTIDDQLLERVSTITATQNRTIQELLIQMLNAPEESNQSETALTPGEPEYDPMTPLMGSLHLDTHDLAENHDSYIGQALYRQMKRGE